MFLNVQDTPNPNVKKIIFNSTINNSEDSVFFTKESQNLPQLVEAVFTVSGVEAVMLGKDFVSVTKNNEEEWAILRPQVLSILIDYAIAGNVSEVKEEKLELNLEDPVIKKIYEIINEKVKPGVAMDGGDISLHKFEDGIVYVKLSGACAGCPSSSATLKDGVERMLKHYVPEVESVEPV